MDLSMAWTAASRTLLVVLEDLQRLLQRREVVGA